jgi:hypothetical protein
MRQRAAQTGLSIKIVTGSLMLLTVLMFIGSAFELVLVWVGLFLSILLLLCYLYAPIAYVLDNEKLVVIRRINSKTFSPVVRCVSIEYDKPSFVLRLWGNGGVFSGSGIFWSREYGIFRAYVTTGKRSLLVLVETAGGKVIISPEKPDDFLNYVI